MIHRKPVVPNNRSIKTLMSEFNTPRVFANQNRNAGRQLASVRTISGRGRSMDGTSGGPTRVGRKRG
jgi:hypothetical protein